MNTEHPITPPPELLNRWADAWRQNKPGSEILADVATEAARWGADQELEACCEFLSAAAWEKLLKARRPEPLSLKQQALDGLRSIECNFPQSQRAFEESCEHIRRALEALPDD